MGPSEWQTGSSDPISYREGDALGPKAKRIDVQEERPSDQDLIFIPLNSVLLPHNTVSHKACTFELHLVSWHCPDMPHLSALVHGPLAGPCPQTSSFLPLPPSVHQNHLLKGDFSAFPSIRWHFSFPWIFITLYNHFFLNIFCLMVICIFLLYLFL